VQLLVEFAAWWRVRHNTAAFASRTAVGGGTQVMLTDGTKIVFQGVSNLTQASFS
jgi:hypothetical protein